MFETVVNFLTGISFRLLFFNVLVVVLLIVSLLSINLYERHLLTEFETSLAQQTGSLAHALSLENQLTKKSVRSLFEKFPKDYRSRIQVFDHSMSLIYNSGNRDWDIGPNPNYLKKKWIYRICGALFNIFHSNSHPAKKETVAEKQIHLPSEVIKTFRGKPSFSIQRDDQNPSPVIVHSAFPILKFKHNIVGVVRISWSANRVLTVVYKTRLSILRVFLWSLLAIVLLNLVISLTIIKPIRQLINQAKGIHKADKKSNYVIKPIAGRDEVAKLSLVLSHFTSKLDKEVIINREFVDDVVHELKNPLTSIRSEAEMASEAKNQNDKETFLSMISEDVSRMEHLLSSVKELSRIKSGRISVKRDAIDVLPLIKNYVNHQQSHSKATISLKSDVQTKILVAIDAHEFIQLIDNLAQNAISFSPKDKPVEITLKQSNQMIQIIISDFGPGISEIHQDKIFKRFYSIRPDNQKKNHTGLGLSIAKSIVEKTGGRIRYHNRIPIGARFIIELPHTFGKDVAWEPV